MKKKELVLCEKWLTKKLNVNYTKKNIELDYLNKNLIDSLDFLKFIFSIQKKYKIEFNNNHFQKRSYRNIEGLAMIILKIKNKKK